MVKRFLIACAALLFASCAQAQITEPFGTFVGGLSNAVAVSNSDALYVLQGGVSKRASPGVISGAAGTPTGSIMWNNSGLLSGFGNWNGTSTVAIGNGGTAQSLRVYNTIDSLATPVNLESGIFDWQTSTNVLTIGTINGGTGVARSFQFIYGGTDVLDYKIGGNGFTTTDNFSGNIQIGRTSAQGSGQVAQLIVQNFSSSGGTVIPQLLLNSSSDWFALGPTIATTVGANNRWRIGGVSTIGGVWDNNAATGFIPLDVFGNLYVYNVIDATLTNFERGAFSFQSNALTIGTEKGGTGQARNLVFETGGTERSRIDTNGTFYVNSSVDQVLDTTNTQVQVAADTVTGNGHWGLTFIGYGNNQFTGGFGFTKTRSSVYTGQTILNNNDRMMELDGYGSDGAKYVFAGAVRLDVDGSPALNSMPSRLVFFTNPGSTTPAERMRIDTNGHVNYTTNAPTANACAGFALSTGSSDTAGRVTFTSATSCAINFANAFGNAPFCSVIPGSAASTVTITTSTTVLTATFGTAQTAMFYQCFGK